MNESDREMLDLFSVTSKDPLNMMDEDAVAILEATGIVQSGDYATSEKGFCSDDWSI